MDGSLIKLGDQDKVVEEIDGSNVVVLLNAGSDVRDNFMQYTQQQHMLGSFGEWNGKGTVCQTIRYGRGKLRPINDLVEQTAALKHTVEERTPFSFKIVNYESFELMRCPPSGKIPTTQWEKGNSDVA